LQNIIFSIMFCKCYIIRKGENMRLNPCNTCLVKTCCTEICPEKLTAVCKTVAIICWEGGKWFNSSTPHHRSTFHLQNITFSVMFCKCCIIRKGGE
jgi:hypothetical protein